MIQYLFPFSRMMTAGLDIWTLSMKIAETLTASQSVITERDEYACQRFSMDREKCLCRIQPPDPGKGCGFQQG